ncbi:MAG: hypothetical protein PVI44_05100 [Balneolaceae bacterium]
MWRVNVTTDDGLVLGKINFQIVRDTAFNKQLLTTRNFD